MARPRKIGDQRRALFIKVRVTLAEKSKLKNTAKNAGLSCSDWVRTRTIDTKPLLQRPSPDREVLLRILAEMGKQGSNINQISRSLNRKNENLEFEIPIKIIMQAIDEIRQLTNQVRETLDHGRNQRKD